MSYTKPGVEITQVQKTVSPNLQAPALPVGLIGPGYYISHVVENPESAFMHNGITVAGTGRHTIDLEAIRTSGLTDMPSGLTAPDAIYAGVYVTNAAAGSSYAQTMIPVISGTTCDTFEYDSDEEHFVISGLAGVTSGLVYIGFRSLRNDQAGDVIEFDSADKIEYKLGAISVFNPLAKAAYLAMQAAGSSVYGFAISGLTAGYWTGGVGVGSGKYENVEAYSMVPLTQAATQTTEVESHCTSMSTAANKKERIMIYSHELTDTGTASTWATAIASYAGSVMNKRSIHVWPTVMYIRERLFSAQYKPSYISSYMQPVPETTPSTTMQYTNALLTGNLTLADGTKYYKGEAITAANWSGLFAEYPFLTVDVPVPGWYGAAIVAGQIAGENPEQSLTNLPVLGISKLKYVADHFSESQLNTIAGGGNYLFWQANEYTRVVCRHQLSTNTMSTETKELSITKTIDYVSKFVRTSLLPFVGRWNINDNLISIVFSHMNAIGEYLKNNGTVDDFVVEKVEQDANQKDVLRVTINVKPLYPANYIRVTLTF